MEPKLTTRSQEAVASALRAASAAGNPALEPVHLLEALTAQPGGVAGGLLDAVGVDRAALDRRLAALRATLPSASGGSVAEPSVSRATWAAITAAKRSKLNSSISEKIPRSTRRAWGVSPMISSRKRTSIRSKPSWG